METNFNLKHTIDQIVKEKAIDKQIIVEALEQAVLTAANKKYRNTRELEAHYNEEIGEVELFEFVTVVEEVQDSYKEIDLEEAREADPEVEIGDSLGMKMVSRSASRTRWMMTCLAVWAAIRLKPLASIFIPRESPISTSGSASRASSRSISL